jgi:hypothetical protein
MPKYVERDWMVSKPGAFGVDKFNEDWERRCRPNAQYLTQTGAYANHLYVYVEEEYGYSSYLWVYPGTAKQLVADWVARQVPWNNSLRRREWWAPNYKGEFDRVRFQTAESERGRPFPRKLELVLCETNEVIEGFSHIGNFDGQAHVHEEDDSYLKVGYYEVFGVRDPKVNILVLDALAAIR